MSKRNDQKKILTRILAGFLVAAMVLGVCATLIVYLVRS